MITSKHKKTCQGKTNLKSKVIAIDGPAGAGKSTVTKLLAKKFNYLYLDTGAMYRAVTLAAMKSHVNFMDSAALTRVARKARISLESTKQGDLRVYLNKELVSKEIRLPIVNSLVSFVARIKEIRRIMVCLQRKIGTRQNCVVEGRDIGTVVFPDAFIKFYLNASLRVRAKRRFRELKQKHLKVSLSETNESIKQRDKNDLTRRVAPLRRAPDAVYVDTSKLTINEVVQKLYRLCRGEKESNI